MAVNPVYHTNAQLRLLCMHKHVRYLIIVGFGEIPQYAYEP